MSFSSDVKEELSKMPVNNSAVNKAEFIGGVILILLGLKILLEHLGMLNF